MGFGEKLRKKIWLLEIENLQKTEKDVLQYLAHYQAVYMVYAKSPVRFGLDVLLKLSACISHGKLKVLKMPKVGKDAADFGWAFIAGQLSTQVNKNTEFEIMSNHHSMQYMVALLKLAKVNAQIIGPKSEPMSQLKPLKFKRKNRIIVT